MRRERFPWAVALLIAGAVVLADQGSKAWVLRTMPGAPPLTVIPGFFDVVLSHNTGGVFGLLAGPPSTTRRVLFTLATGGALAVLGVLLRQWGSTSPLALTALALVAGGAVGNLVDRLRFGSVVDFIDWHWRSYHWYTFNVADAAITSGAALLLLHSFLPEHRPDAACSEAARTSPEG